MSASPDLQAKSVERLRTRLTEIDPRLGARPQPHPFQQEIDEGAAAISRLLEIAEDAGAEDERRSAAANALAVILAHHPAEHGVAKCLAELSLRDDAHPPVRAEAMRALVCSGHPKFMRAFEARLASEDPGAAAAAAHAMGLARHKESVPALIELMAKTAYPEVRAAAARALGEIGDGRALEILAAAFRAQLALVPVIRAIGQLGTAEHMALLTVGLWDASAEVRLATAEALADILRRTRGGDHDALVPYLKVALEREQDPQVAVVLIACFTRLRVRLPADLLEQALGLGAAGQD